MLKNWPSYQILLGRSLKSSQHLNEDMKEYVWERKGLGKKRGDRISPSGIHMEFFYSMAGSRDWNKTWWKKYRLVQASVTVQLWCESTCCVCTPTDTPQHHSLPSHGPTHTPPSMLLTIWWHSSSVASSSSCSLPSLWLLILKPQFHQRR